MSRLGKHTKKKEDNYSVGSKKKLKSSIEHKIKRMYIEILESLENEVKAGRMNQSVYKATRSRILNIANDKIRILRKELDERYNVEFITFSVVIPVKPIKGGPEAIVDGKGLV